MLTGKMVRVRFARDRILPYYIDYEDESWLEAAERLLELFRGQEGRTRGELEDDQREAFGDDPAQLVHQGLAKLLEDRCEFETQSDRPPEELRAAVFQASAAARLTLGADGLLVPFDRAGVLSQVAEQLGATPEAVENGLFADLKSEQRLTKFKDLTAQRLLQRYNVALAQAVLLRAHKLQVVVRGEAPPRYRHLLRRIKFHRLICEVERLTADSFRLHLDGPLSLFSATQRYGLQLALFLPTVLLCRDFEVRAEIRWGPQKKLKFLLIGPGDGLVSHDRETGCYTPPELQMFVDLFRKRITDWELHEDVELVPLDGAFWAPDFRLRHVETGREVLLEILGFWRRSGLERHLQRLRRVDVKFLLAVSDQLHIEEDALESLPAGVHRFRNMPLPDEIARLATAVLEDRP